MKPGKQAKAGRAEAEPSGKAGHADKTDYSKVSPEDIRAEIDRTRAHMDRALTQLGAKLSPRPKVKAALIGAGGILLSLAAWAAVRAILGSHADKLKRAKASPWRWRDAGILEQVLLAKKLVGAARKGRPAIIVVEPRKI